jgi:6-phosphogluconolactonase
MATSDGPEVPARAVRLYAGTYASDGGAGLASVSYTADAGWTAGASYKGARNASFGVYSPRFGLHYLVDEQSDGAVGAYRETTEGWRAIARVGTDGAEPCYLALDREEKWLAVANYGSGSIALFALGPESGAPSETPILQRNEGSGPVADRQDGPHAHCALFGPDGRWLYHVDLGTDEVLAHPFDHDRGSLGERILAYRAPAGAGPRHIVFHPHLPIALLVCELAATLTVLRVGDGTLAAQRTVSTAPADFAGDNLGGHLALNTAGDRVYVTNRGHDSIAVFALDDAGDLDLLQHVPSGGASPRFFLFLEAERLLVLANEEGGNLRAFAIADDGKLSPLPGDLALPGAVFIAVARGPAPDPGD